MIDTRLITFLTLLEEKNYTNTAKRLYITQPAVTHHIKSLEKEMNVILFADPKTFELTGAGDVLVKYAKASIEQHKLLENSLAKAKNEMAVSIAFTPFVSTILDNFGILTFFKTLKSKLNVNVDSYDRIINGLSDGSIDFAIVDDNYDNSIFEGFNLFSANIDLICNVSGKYINKDKIDINDFKNSSLILTEENTGLYKNVIHNLKSKNIQISNEFILKTNNPNWLINLIESNDGIGFIYHDAAQSYIDKGRVKKLEFKDFNASQSINLIYNRDAHHTKEITTIISNLRRFLVE